MRITQRMTMDNVQRNLAAGPEALAALQDQIASGKRLHRASDDPRGVSTALSLEALSRQNDQYLRNIDSAKSWLDATGSALDRLGSLLSNARDLAVRGATETLGVDERKALGKQMDGLLSEALSVVNSTLDGKYLFAGFATDSAPFAADGSFTQAPSGPVGDMKREIRSGVEVVINLRGNCLVDGQMPLQRALTTLIALRDDLNAGNSVSAGSLQDLDSCSSGVVALQGEVGAMSSRLEATEKSLNDEQVSVAARLSKVMDTDMAEAVTQLTAQETAYQTALEAAARVLQPSLLDFLR